MLLNIRCVICQGCIDSFIQEWCTHGSWLL